MIIFLKTVGNSNSRTQASKFELYKDSKIYQSETLERSKIKHPIYSKDEHSDVAVREEFSG